MFDLSEKVAIVTGGNGGIGLGIARGLARCGAAVMVAARDRDKMDGAVKELNDINGKAMCLEVDVTDNAMVREMVGQTVSKLGRLDILVNNAGIGLRKRPEDYTLDEFTQVINTNLIALFTCCQAAYPELKRGGGGKIVNIGSMASLFGHPFASPYAAAKGGVVQLTKSLAIAWAPENIQVNAILPGWIETDMTSAARRFMPELHDRVLARTPAGRWGRPDDLAGAAAFLASPASDFVTGASIAVDGGYAIQMP